MTVAGVRNTPAMRAGQRPSAPRTYTQEQQRERRRQGLHVALGRRWSLRDEVAAIVEPLTAVDRPRPLSYRRCVDDLTDAVHALVHEVISLLARADAERRTRHIGIDQRGRSIRALVDLAERPTLPVITDQMLADGSWAQQVIALAEPYSTDLTKLLGNAATTAVSDRVVAGLRAVDAVAATLARRLTDTTLLANAPAPVPTAADLARAELEALGVQL